MASPFKITNHNRYQNKILVSGRTIDGYDHYSMQYVTMPGFFPDRNLMAHKAQVILHLKEDINKDIDQWISITPAEIRTYGFIFSLFVYEPERSALIKLIYS